jgi:quercetin dioxygenase-like cupin family protein
LDWLRAGEKIAGEVNEGGSFQGARLIRGPRHLSSPPSLLNGAEMLTFDWSQVPQEQLNERFSRKFIHGEKIMVAQIFLKRGCVVPEHSHESEQMCLIVIGSLQFNFGGEEKVLQSNQAVNIPSHLKHSVVALEDTLAYDIFSPIRHDWLAGDDAYLRTSSPEAVREKPLR